MNLGSLSYALALILLQKKKNIYIYIFFALVGNYYTVDQLEIVVNQKLLYEVERKALVSIPERL